MGLVKSEHYAHVDCDAEDCPEWQRFIDPLLLTDALARMVPDGWVVIWTGRGLRTYCCQECAERTEGEWVSLKGCNNVDMREG